MLRKINIFKLFGNVFIIFIISYMIFMYYVFAYRNGWGLPTQTLGLQIHLVLMHLLLFLCVFSFFHTIISHPGRVPLFWGFFLDDPDHKRRRYCLICHIFKPERCHHCSACNQCVLNMDHHCPWLNNCIGFYNRKFFLLLLFYAILSMAEIGLFFLPDWIYLVIRMFKENFDLAVNPEYLTIVGYALNCTMVVVLGMFFSFHIKLIVQNMTTIEWMDKKRGAESKAENINYDMGIYYNFIQIFGKNPWLWFLPVFCKSGKPIGDGVVWPQKPSKAQSFELESSVKDGTNPRNSQAGADARVPESTSTQTKSNQIVGQPSSGIGQGNKTAGNVTAKYDGYQGDASGKPVAGKDGNFVYGAQDLNQKLLAGGAVYNSGLNPNT